MNASSLDITLIWDHLPVDDQLWTCLVRASLYEHRNIHA